MMVVAWKKARATSWIITVFYDGSHARSDKESVGHPFFLVGVRSLVECIRSLHGSGMSINFEHL